MEGPDKILLILDLDETLIHAAERPLPRPHDFVVGPYFVYRRPHLGAFLETCAVHYRLAVWSSASDGYVRGVVGQIMPKDLEPALAWSQSRCIRRYDFESFEDYFVKDLRKVKRAGYPLERVLIVEDTPRKVERNYGNAVYVPPYFGESDDDVLPRLGRYLTSICGTPNVRMLEKRGWIRTVPDV